MTRNPDSARALDNDHALSADLDRYRERVEAALERALASPPHYPAQRLFEAMRYSVLGGGKRIRPQLVYASGRALDIDEARLDACACAIECIHAYSLIHDDLPAMDDDDLRRGRPTCHRAFDEATAILAGDALQALAFDLLANDHSVDAAVASRRVALLARASGALGMVGGQMIDLAAVGDHLDQAQLETMHAHKTGALIRASVALPAIGTESTHTADALDALDRYGRAIGLAFQVHDDVLDVIGDTATLGKRSGADDAHDKPTFAQLLGVQGARDYAMQLCREALDAAEQFGQRGAHLAAIASFIVEREH